MLKLFLLNLALRALEASLGGKGVLSHFAFLVLLNFSAVIAMRSEPNMLLSSSSERPHRNSAKIPGSPCRPGTTSEAERSIRRDSWRFQNTIMAREPSAQYLFKSLDIRTDGRAIFGIAMVTAPF